MDLTLSEAAKLIKKTKQTVLNSINKGRISASKDAMGQWKIDSAELFRVYPYADKGHGEIGQHSADLKSESDAVIRELRARLVAVEELKRHIEARADELREERDAWKRQAEEWMHQAKALPAGAATPTEPGRGQDGPISPLQASGDELVNITPPEAKKRHWWQFWGNDEHGK